MARPCLPHLTGDQAGDVTNRTFMSVGTVMLAMKDFGTTVFTGSPVQPEVPAQFFNGIWACTPFPYSGSVLCHCHGQKLFLRLSLLTMTNPNQMREVLLFVCSKMVDETNLSSKLPVADSTKEVWGRKLCWWCLSSGFPLHTFLLGFADSESITNTVLTAVIVESGREIQVLYQLS